MPKLAKNEDLIIGATVHNLIEARAAMESGADYLSVGSVYHTCTKEDIRVVGPGVLTSICEASTLPTIAIGGIDESRIREVMLCGVQGIALISAVLDSKDPGTAARKMGELVDRLLDK